MKVSDGWFVWIFHALSSEPNLYVTPEFPFNNFKETFQKHLKNGWVKAKVIRKGEGILKVLPPLPPPPQKKFYSYTKFLGNRCFLRTIHFMMIYVLPLTSVTL